MKSLHKALDILEVYLHSDSSEVRLSDLAMKTGLNITTVRRMASVFLERGYMSQPENRGKYALGTKFLAFSSVIKKKTVLSDIARPHLVRLNEIVKEAVVLFGFDNDKFIFLSEISSKYPLKFTYEPDGPPPLYGTAAGKIYLAEKSEKDQNEFIRDAGLRAYTPNTITDPKKLRKHLLSVHANGISYDFEEYAIGLMAAAASIRNEEEKLIGCISVMGPSVRLTAEKLRNMELHLKQCAMKISMGFGYQKA